MIPIFAGFDPRESVGYYVFCHSVMRRVSQPVSIAPLALSLLAGYRESHTDGTNEFIYSRFLVPWLQGYRDWALFVDGADMLCLADVAELWALREAGRAVQVVKHAYRTRHARKYLGTTMEADNADYPRKNWSSLMLMNCAHPSWRSVTPAAVSRMKGSELHRFDFLADEAIGELPPEWNHLVGEYAPRPGAKLVHYTLGIPGFPRYRDCEYAAEWFVEREDMMSASALSEPATA